jgi:tetratricopeptide (TPR) repeat protein
VPAAQVLCQVSPSAPVVDEEYSRYKKRGDDFFKEGKYVEALRQYQNCLEVPGFENDTYVKDQITKCTTGLTLRQQATDALQQGKGRQAVELFNQLLSLNSNDAVTKPQIADYYEREGNRLFNQQQYPEARDNYVRALRYTATRQETMRLQIQTIDNIIFKQVKHSKQIGLKLFTGAVAIGAGVYGLLLRSDYQSKMNRLNQISQQVDSSGTGIIANPDAYRQYNDAYNAAQAAQQKNGLFKACIGVAALATIAEIYLLMHKPKSHISTWQWGPSSQSWGLAVGYTF